MRADFVLGVGPAADPAVAPGRVPRMFDSLIPLTTDAEIRAMAQHFVGEALRRQTWIWLLDDDARVMDTVIQLDGIPADPDPEDVAILAARLHELVDATDAHRLVLVWERPGGPDLRMQEADWVAGVAAAGLPLRLQLLSSDDGVRVLDPDFDAIVAA